nr:transposase [Enterobacter kobei]
MTYYADDGWAEADNSLAENVLRMVSLGRKICVRQKWLKGWTA